MREYRGLILPEPGLYPFWFWNGRQEKNEITRQLELFHECGCLGAVIHARTGNRTPYLSDEWMALFRHACEDAKRLGLKIWIYDEDGFPSGNAGGRVQAGDPGLQQKYLSFSYAGTEPDSPAFAAFDPARNYCRIDEKSVPAGTRALRFQLNRKTDHVDTFHPETVRRFIKITHERYAECLSEYFGSVIQAVYTDDESFQCCCINGFPWSEYLEKAYREKTGRELSGDLPKLIEDLPGFDRVRMDFYTTASALFLENFIRPQCEWAERHGLAYTGHLCCDEGPFTVCVKGFYEPNEYQKLETVPAIDDFICEMLDSAYLRRPFTTGFNTFQNIVDKRAPLPVYKTASSIAHQFAKGLFSAESLTLLTWACTPALADEQMMFETGMGVNLITPHAFYYTLGRGTKNDCPPSYFFQQPFFSLAGAMYKKWTRTAALLLRGTFHADALLIYPAATAVAEGGSEIDTGFVREMPRLTGVQDDLQTAFAEQVLALHRGHVGFDVVSESMLCGEARVEPDGMIRIGDMLYRSLLLPRGYEILPETRAFLAANNIRPVSENSLLPDLEISGDGTEEILVHTRDTDGVREYYLLNLSGRALRPAIALDHVFSCYDPATEKIIFSGEKLPDDFILPDGAAIFLLRADFEAEHGDFRTSAFAPFTPSVIPELNKIFPLDANILAFPKTDRAEFYLEPGAALETVYAEDLDTVPLTLNGETLTEAVAPHAADPCYSGLNAAGKVRAGRNEIRAGRELGMLYLSGKFRAFGRTLAVPCHEMLHEGDLAAQGYGHYWGAFSYTYLFHGTPSRIRVSWDGGMMEVFVNGVSCGVISGKPGILTLKNVHADGVNALDIVFCNTARNFVCGEPAAFGIRSVELS